MKMHNTPEFRFYYFTIRYRETVSFYENMLQLEIMRSWDRGELNRGTIFHSPNGKGFIEIEEGPEIPILHGGLYIQVDDVDAWYQKAIKNNINIIQPLTDASYGHRSFKFEDPNKLVIGLFKYL